MVLGFVGLFEASLPSAPTSNIATQLEKAKVGETKGPCKTSLKRRLGKEGMER